MKHDLQKEHWRWLAMIFNHQLNSYVRSVKRKFVEEWRTEWDKERFCELLIMKSTPPPLYLFFSWVVNFLGVILGNKWHMVKLPWTRQLTCRSWKAWLLSGKNVGLFSRVVFNCISMCCSSKLPAGLGPKPEKTGCIRAKHEPWFS